MTRVIIGDFRTGKRILDLPVLRLSWETTRNRAETIRATVTLTDRGVRALKLGSAATPGKSFLAVVENDQFMGGGPIWTHTYDRDAKTLTMTAAGMWSYFDHRLLLPILTTGDNVQGSDTVLTGYDYGTIAKWLVVQAWQWTGGQVPLVVQPDRAGTRERTYLGADLDVVGTVLEQLTTVENGPDIEFRPRWTADRLGVEWFLRTGSETQPRLRSATVHRWDYSVEQPAIAGLSVTTDASQLTGHAFTAGGRASDEVLIARRYNPALVTAGFPLLQSVDSSHASVTEFATLDEYSAEAVRVGATPNEFWSFRVKADKAPRVGEYWIGDQIVIKMRGDLFIPDGDYLWTIASLSGDEKGEWINVKTTATNG